MGSNPTSTSYIDFIKIHIYILTYCVFKYYYNNIYIYFNYLHEKGLSKLILNLFSVDLVETINSLGIGEVLSQISS